MRRALLRGPAAGLSLLLAHCSLSTVPPHYKTSCVATCVNFFQRFPLGCGGMRTLTKLNGSIESPNKPCSYGGEQDCHWSIQPNSSSPIETIWMWFEGVNLAYDGHGDRHCG